MKMTTIKLTISILFLFIATACNSKKSDTTVSDKIPKAHIQAQTLGDTLVVKIQIPPNHHAYMDSGPDDLFIPISFDWTKLIHDKVISSQPERIKSPPSEANEEGVKVLRGMGEFIFKAPIEALSGKDVNVRTQLCDDLQGICYRPATDAITIQ